MGVRTLHTDGSGREYETLKCHNAADHVIRFRYEGRVIEVDPGSEFEVNAAYATRVKRVARVAPSPEIGGKDALIFLSPHLAVGPAPKAEPEPVKTEGKPARKDEPKPEAKPAPSVDEVGALIADNSSEELRKMAKDLGVSLRGNMSDQTVAEKIVAAMND